MRLALCAGGRESAARLIIGVSGRGRIKTSRRNRRLTLWASVSVHIGLTSGTTSSTAKLMPCGDELPTCLVIGLFSCNQRNTDTRSMVEKQKISRDRPGANYVVA